MQNPFTYGNEALFLEIRGKAFNGEAVQLEFHTVQRFGIFDFAILNPEFFELQVAQLG